MAVYRCLICKLLTEKLCCNGFFTAHRYSLFLKFWQRQRIFVQFPAATWSIYKHRHETMVVYRCSIHKMLTGKLHCNDFFTAHGYPLFLNSNKDREFLFNFWQRREFRRATGDPPPPTPWQGLFIMYYWLCMIDLFIILSYGSHFLLIIINPDTILAAFIHSFLCDVDF